MSASDRTPTVVTEFAVLVDSLGGVYHCADRDHAEVFAEFRRLEGRQAKVVSRTVTTTPWSEEIDWAGEPE